MTLTATGNFIVSPGPALILWTALVGLTLICATITAAKGLWGWLLVGFLTGGILWLVSAFLPAAPDSFWARHARSRGNLDAAPGR